MRVTEVRNLLGGFVERAEGSRFPAGEDMLPLSLKGKQEFIAYWLLRRNGIDNMYYIAFDRNDSVVGKTPTFVGPPWEGEPGIPGIEVRAAGKAEGGATQEWGQ
jgi:hypothetical protein